MSASRGRPRNWLPYFIDGQWRVRTPKLVVLKATSKLEAMSETVDLQREMENGTSSYETLIREPPMFQPPKETDPNVSPLRAALASRPATVIDGAPPAQPSKPTNTKPGQSKKPTLTDAEKQQYHALLSGIVCQANVLMVAAGVKMFGRQPEEPSPADKAMLEKAWQAQLDTWFGSTEISPMVLILSASVGLGIGMYAGGEPIPKKDDKKVIDGTQAKSAPVELRPV